MLCLKKNLELSNMLEATVYVIIKQTITAIS